MVLTSLIIKTVVLESFWSCILLGPICSLKSIILEVLVCVSTPGQGSCLKVACLDQIQSMEKNHVCHDGYWRGLAVKVKSGQQSSKVCFFAPVCVQGAISQALIRAEKANPSHSDIKIS